MTSGILDGLVRGLILIGIAIGVVVSGILFLVVPWIHSHLTIGWTP